MLGLVVALWMLFCVSKSLQYTDADFAFGKHSLRNKNGFCDGECVDDSQDPSALVRPKNYKSSYPGIAFRPAVLSYTNSPVCIPSVAEFLIDNTQDHDIQLYEVISDNTQFHPVLFQPQTLPSQHSLTVQLLFLPYYVESTNSTLTVSSSEGETYYTVRGTAVGNAYQLHPFVGNRIPSGVAYEQPLVIYNPFSDLLYIREVFTTEDFLTLRGAPIEKQMKMTDASSPGMTIDKGKQSAVSAVKSAYWEVESGTRKEIIRLSMASSVPGDYHGYIHVKTSRDNIVIPVDLYVVEGGLVAIPEVLDFGVMTSASESSNLELWIQNNGLVDVLVTDIIPVEPDPHLVLLPSDKETNQPTVIKAGEKAMIGRIMYDAEVAGHFQNKLLVVTTHPNPVLATIEVVYEGIVMRGGIGFEEAQTIFYIPVGITAASVSSGSFQDQVDGASGESGNSASLPTSGAMDIRTIHSRIPSLSSNSSNATNIGTRQKMAAGSRSPNTAATNAAFEVSVAAGNLEVSGDYSSKSSVVPIDESADGRQTIVLESVIDRTFTFTNYFSAPVSLDAVSSSTCADMILIRAVPSDNVAQPLEEWPPVVLQFNHAKAITSLINEQRVKKSDLQLPFNCWLELYTNVSAHRIPLHIVDGSVVLAYHDVANVDKPVVKPAKKKRNKIVGTAPVVTDGSDYINLDQFESILDIGSISAISPKPVLVLATNFNPYRVPITLLQSDLNVSMCFVASWITNLNTADKDHVSYHVANSLGLKLPNASITLFPQYGHCINFDPLNDEDTEIPFNTSEPNVTRASRTSLPASIRSANVEHQIGDFVEENLFNMTRRQYNNSLFVESGCATLFSVTIHGRFPTIVRNSSGNVTNSSSLSIAPKKKESVLISSRGIFSSKKTATEPVGLENLTETFLSFKTPHQVFGLDIRFQPVSGTLISAVHPGNRTFVLGQLSPMVVHAISTFPNELGINSLSSYSNHYFIAPLSLSFINHNHEVGSAGSSVSSASVSTWGQPMVSLLPQQMCTFFNKTNGESIDLFSCMKQILTVLRRNATSATHLDGYSNFNVAGEIADSTKRRAFDALVHRIDVVQNHIGNIYSLIDAHLAIVKLKVAWSNVFPLGYQLPAGEISLKTTLTHHVVQVPPTYVLTPIVLLPDVTQLHLPVTNPEQITVFYIRCQNPFSIPITFRLHDLNKNKQTSLVGSKIWKAVPSEIMDLFKWPLYSTFVPSNDIYLQDNVTGFASLKESFFKQSVADDVPFESSEFTAAKDDSTINEIMNLPGKSFGFLGDSLPNSNPSSGGTAGSGSRTIRRGLRGLAARSQKSRRISIIEGIEYRTMVREDTQPDLTYLSAAKAPPTNEASGSSSAGGGAKQQKKSPFVVHPSVATSEWITAAHSVALVGPIVFIPSLAPGLNPNSLFGDNSDDNTDSDVVATYETTIYIMNNYTGVERVDLSAAFGSPAIHVQSLETSSYDDGKYKSPVVLAMYDKNGVDTSTIDMSGNSTLADSIMNASVVRYNTSPGNAAWGSSITSFFSPLTLPPHWIPLSPNASIKTVQRMPAKSSSDNRTIPEKETAGEIEIAYALSVSALNQRVVVQVKNTGKVAFQMADVLVNERSVCNNDERWNDVRSEESGRFKGGQVKDGVDLYDEAYGSDYRFLYSSRWGVSGIASRPPSPTASYIWKFGESASIIPKQSTEDDTNDGIDELENSTLKSYRVRNSFNSPKSRCEVKNTDVLLSNESIPSAGNYTFIVNAFPHCPVKGALKTEILHLSLIPFSSLVDSTFDMSSDGGMLTFAVILEPSEELVHHCSQHPRPAPTPLLPTSYYYAGVNKQLSGGFSFLHPLFLTFVFGAIAVGVFISKYRSLLTVSVSTPTPVGVANSAKPLPSSMTHTGTGNAGKKKKNSGGNSSGAGSGTSREAPALSPIKKAVDNINVGAAVSIRDVNGKDSSSKANRDSKGNAGQFSPAATNTPSQAPYPTGQNTTAPGKALPQTSAVQSPLTAPVTTTTVAPAADVSVPVPIVSSTTVNAKKKGSDAIVAEGGTSIAKPAKSTETTPTGAPSTKTSKNIQSVSQPSSSGQGKSKKTHDARASDVVETSADLQRMSLKAYMPESLKFSDKSVDKPVEKSNEKGKSTKLSRSNSGKEKVATSVDIASSTAVSSSGKGKMPAVSTAATSNISSSGSSNAGNQASDVIAAFNGQGSNKRGGVAKTRIVVMETNSTEEIPMSSLAPQDSQAAVPSNDSIFTGSDSLFMPTVSADPLGSTSSSLFSSYNIFGGSGDLSDAARPIDLSSYVPSDAPEEYALPSLNPRDGSTATAFSSTPYDLMSTGPSLNAWSDMPSYSAHGPPGLTASPGRSFHTANGTGMEHMVSGLIGSETAGRGLSLSTAHGSVASLQDHSYDKMLSLSPLSPRHFSPSASSPPTDELPLEESATPLDGGVDLSEESKFRRVERSDSAISAPDELDANSGAFIPQTGRSLGGFPSPDVHPLQADKLLQIAEESLQQHSSDHPLHDHPFRNSSITRGLFADSHSASTARPSSWYKLSSFEEQQRLEQQRRVQFQQGNSRVPDSTSRGGGAPLSMYKKSLDSQVRGLADEYYASAGSSSQKSAWSVGEREGEQNSSSTYRPVFNWLKSSATSDTAASSHPSSDDRHLRYLGAHTQTGRPPYNPSPATYGGSYQSSPYAGSKPYDSIPDHKYPGADEASGTRPAEGSAGSDNDSIVNWLKGSPNREGSGAQNTQNAQNAYLARHTTHATHTGNSSSDPFSPPPPGMSPLPAPSYYGNGGNVVYGDYLYRHSKGPARPSMTSSAVCSSTPIHEEYYRQPNQNDRASRRVRPPLSNGGSPHDQYQPSLAGSLHVPDSADSIVSRLDSFSSGVGVSPGTSSVASNHSIQHNPLPPMTSDGDNSTSINDDDSVASSLTAASSSK